MKIFMMKATSSKAWSDYIIVKKDSKILSIKQLEGKKIGVYPGSVQKALLKIIMQQNGVSEKKYKRIELPPTIQLSALKSGSVDALLTYDQIAILAIEKGIARTLEENPLGKYVADPLYGFPYVLSSEFINKNPQDAKKIRDAFYEAIEYIEENDKDSRRIMAEWTSTEESITQKVNLWDQVKAEKLDVAKMQHLADIYFKEGVISQKQQISKIYFFGAGENG